MRRASLDPIRARGMTCALLLLLGSGCAVPATHKRWAALDALEQVSFRVEARGPERALLRWRVESRDLRDRQGSALVVLKDSDCERVAFEVEGEPHDHESRPRWRSLDPHWERLEADDAARPRSTGGPCTVVVELEHWQKRLSPRFDLRYEQHSIGGITTPPPRRTGWLAMYPFAAVADVALAVPVGLAFVGAWLLPFVPDFTWVPGSDPNWHRKRTRERQEQEEQAPPLPSGWESPPD